MARLPYLTPDDVAEEDRELLERPINYYRVLAHHPEALRRFSQVALWLRWGSELDPRLRELAILQVAYTSNCGYEFAHHVDLAEQFGVAASDVTALLRDEQGLPNELDDTVRAALRVARTLTVDQRLLDEDWDRLQGTLGTEPCLELILTVTYYNHVVRALQALRVDLEPEYEGVLERYPRPGGWT